MNVRSTKEDVASAARLEEAVAADKQREELLSGPRKRCKFDPDGNLPVTSGPSEPEAELSAVIPAAAADDPREADAMLPALPAGLPVTAADDHRGDLRVDHLPDEILIKILSYCGIFNIHYRISRVSLRFRKLCQDYSLWSLIRFDGDYVNGIRHYYGNSGSCCSNLHGRTMVRVESWEAPFLRKHKGLFSRSTSLPPTWVAPCLGRSNYSSRYYGGFPLECSNEQEIITAAGNHLLTLVLTDKEINSNELIINAVRSCPRLEAIYALGCPDISKSVVENIGQYGISLRHLFLNWTTYQLKDCWYMPVYNTAFAASLNRLTSICISTVDCSFPMKAIADNCTLLEVFTLPHFRCSKRCIDCHGIAPLNEESIGYFLQHTKQTLRHLHIFFRLTRPMFLHLRRCTLLETLKVHNAERLGELTITEMKTVLEELSALKVLSIGNEEAFDWDFASLFFTRALLQLRMSNIICLELTWIEYGAVSALPLVCPELRGLRLNDCYVDSSSDDEWVWCIKKVVNGCRKLSSLEVWGNEPLVQTSTALQKVQKDNTHLEVFRVCWIEGEQLVLIDQGAIQYFPLPDDAVLTSAMYKKALQPTMYREAWGLE